MKHSSAWTIPLAVTIWLAAALALLGQDRRIVPLGAGGKRVALVVGNAAYINIQPLANSANDARDMAAALRDTGFTTVIERENASRETLEAAVDEFIRALKPGDIAMFYYSGHGMQINGENYLAAVDLNVLNEVQARSRSLKASEVLEEMETSGAALNIVVLDACRDNPFGATRSIGGQGLAPMNAGKGTLIAYATAPGHTADDNRQARNGLYTSYLLQALHEPGLSLEQLFKRAGGMVQQASGGRQIPWISSSVNGEFYFRPGTPSNTLAVPPVSVERTAGTAADVDAWEAIRASNSPELFQQFLKEYPSSQYAGAARLKLALLSAPSMAPKPAAEVKTQSPPADETPPRLIHRAPTESTEPSKSEERPTLLRGHAGSVPEKTESDESPGEAAPNSMRIGQIDISHFIGLTPSDTGEKAIAIFGKPNQANPQFLMYYSGSVAGALLVPGFGRMRPVIDIVLNTSGHIAEVKIWDASWVRKRGVGGPLLDLLGKTQSESTAALGAPTRSEKSLSIWDSDGDSSGARLELTFERGKCALVRVVWERGGAGAPRLIRR